MNYLQKYQRELRLNPDGIIGPKTATAIMDDLGIKDKIYFAHLMAQIDHESAGFSLSRENLNYSAKRLAAIWPKRFSAFGEPNELAYKLARNPQAIANNVYANRLGNGNESSGDGWKYRGFGGIQLTGKTNIQNFFKSIGVSVNLDPDEILGNPKNYFLTGKYFFETNGIDKHCTSISDKCIEIVTRKINGGLIGIADRKEKTKYMAKVLGIT